jgi:hypothetical protein
MPDTPTPDLASSRGPISLHTAIGTLFGAAGYVLGVRRFGVVTVVISVVSLEFVLMAAQGYIPSIEPTDPRARNP